MRCVNKLAVVRRDFHFRHTDTHTHTVTLSLSHIRSLTHTHTHTHTRFHQLVNILGTYEFMAPEVLAKQAEYDESVDVYSFAFLLWEMWVRIRPYTHLKNFGTILRQVSKGERPPTNETGIRALYAKIVRQKLEDAGRKDVLFDDDDDDDDSENVDGPFVSSEWPEALCDLLSCCWHSDPSKRPSFVEIDKLWHADAMVSSLLKARTWFGTEVANET